MSYLEELLKNSSEQERDLMPPPGQWAAIQRQLQPAPVANTPVGRSWPGWKWPTVLLLLITGLLITWLMPRQGVRVTELGSFPLAVDPRSAKSVYLQLPSVNDLSDPPPAILDQQGQIPPVITSRPEARSLPVKPTTPAIAQGQAPSEAQALSISIDTQINSAVIDKLVVDEQIKTITGSNVKESDKNDGLQSAVPSLALLPGRPFLMPHLREAAGRSGHVDLVPLQLPIRRSGPRRWYVQASLHASAYTRSGYIKSYQTTPNGNTPTAIPITGTNEWLQLYEREENPGFNAGQAMDRFYGLSVGHRFRWGLDISLGAMLFQQPDPEAAILRALPATTDHAYSLSTESILLLHGHIDLRYVFLRRHRLRPYIGGSLVGLFMEDNRYRRTFYYPDQDLVQLTNSQRYQVWDFFADPVPVPRLGVQYSLHPRWQIQFELLSIYPGLILQYGL